MEVIKSKRFLTSHTALPRPTPNLPTFIWPQPSPTTLLMKVNQNQHKNFTAVFAVFALITLSFSQNVSISVTSQRLNNLLSQLNSINDSIEQIKIQANQSRTVDLNLTASLDIDIFSGCIVERQQPCQTTLFGYCLTLTNFFEEVS